MDKLQNAKRILEKASALEKGKEISLAKEFISINDKVDTVAQKADKLAEDIDTKLLDIKEELKKKLESELVLEIDREELKGEKGDKGQDGKDYILTDKDKKEIAKSIKVPVVEKVIEKTEVIRETPIITNEIKEVAKYEEASEIKDKLESLKNEERLDASAIKNLPEAIQSHGAKGRLVRVAHDDTITGDGTPANPLGVVGSAFTDEKVKLSASDPTAGYLADKIVAGTGITISEGTGADENKLKITGTPDLSEYLTDAPEDGRQYSRKDGVWSQINSIYISATEPVDPYPYMLWYDIS